MSPNLYDVAVVGGGILGLSSALAILERQPALRLVILEKEGGVGLHQTGHNSGVIHMGIYYRPGSLKARLSVEGARLMTEYCAERKIRVERYGKVIIAVGDRERQTLRELYRRGIANGVPELRLVNKEELREIEPCADGDEALYSPRTSSVNYLQVADAMADDVRRRGASISFGARVDRVTEGPQCLRLHTDREVVEARYLINCAGLYADTLARRAGASIDVRIVPFRGEYYFLADRSRWKVHGLIYPVPDPQLPFLGVHFTRSVDGKVEAGPNAVLALAREGYTKTRIRPRELWETLTYPGFGRLAVRHWRTGFYEYRRSLSKDLFAHSLRRLVPSIEAADLIAGGSGVRAQAVGRDGNLLDDFAIVQSSRAIHVLNAPSPAATASLAIGRYIANLAAKSILADYPVH